MWFLRFSTLSINPIDMFFSFCRSCVTCSCRCFSRRRGIICLYHGLPDHGRIAVSNLLSTLFEVLDERRSWYVPNFAHAFCVIRMRIRYFVRICIASRVQAACARSFCLHGFRCQFYPAFSVSIALPIVDADPCLRPNVVVSALVPHAWHAIRMFSGSSFGICY